MIAIVHELLPFVLLLYLLDGLTYVRCNHWLFVSRLGGGFRQQAGLWLVGLWPGTRVYAAHRLPVGLTPEGVWLASEPCVTDARRCDCGSYRFWPFATLPPLAVEHHTLRLGSGLSLPFPSPAHATHFFNQVHELQGLPAAKRGPRLVEMNAASNDVQSFVEHEQWLARLSQPLPGLSASLLGAVFVVLPLSTLFQGELLVRWVSSLLLVIGLGHLVVWSFALRLGLRLRRAGFPLGLGVLLPILLSPPATWRAPVSLLRNLCYRYDALAMAAALLPLEAVVPRIRAEFHVIRHALNQAGEAPPDWRWLWEDREARLRALVQALDLEVDMVLQPPPPQDPHATAYCPHCEGEYRQASVWCSTCDLPLLLYPANA